MTSKVLESFMKFSVDGRPCQSRIFRDNIDLQDMSENYQFLMSFGAPANLAKREKKSFWYKVPDAPDKTVDLRVYVPCLCDRLLEEVRVPPLKIWRISGSVSSKLKVPHMLVHSFQISFGLYYTGSSVQLVISKDVQGIDYLAQMVRFSLSLAYFGNWTCCGSLGNVRGQNHSKTALKHKNIGIQNIMLAWIFSMHWRKGLHTVPLFLDFLLSAVSTILWYLPLSAGTVHSARDS